ncbi:MAG: DNA polymerase III subunit [bacterium]|nr:DNA polymerase III subunit [bacterium]
MNQQQSMELIGHNAARVLLDRLAADGGLAHAYLFAGPPHVGKTTLARWLAQRLLCTGDAVRPCGACTVCAHIASGVHADVRVLAPEEGTIGVDAARVWTDTLVQSSLFAGWKIGMVEAAEVMTESAANACLKAIEEPTPRTVIILTASRARGVLPTIASRCAIVRLGAVPEAVIASALEARGIADAAIIAALADGAPGRALAYAEDATRMDVVRAYRTTGDALATGSIAARLRSVEKIVSAFPKDRAAVRAEVDEIVKAFERAVQQRLRAPHEHLAHWQDVLHALARVPRLRDANVAPRLILESLVLAHP